MTSNAPFVSVLMGSDTDFPTVKYAIDVLADFGIAYEVKITSAHRTPELTHVYVRRAEARGCMVFIAAAGMAAHLAGTTAALTTRPVIGIPMEGGALHGMDALLSTVQMPGGVPVACTAIGKAGAINAAYLAAAMLALNDVELDKKLKEAREKQAASVREKDEALQKQMGN